VLSPFPVSVSVSVSVSVCLCVCVSVCLCVCVSVSVQSHVMQAAADISSILAGEKKKKGTKLDANRMAALALIFNPVCAQCPHRSVHTFHLVMRVCLPRSADRKTDEWQEQKTEGRGNAENRTCYISGQMHLCLREHRYGSEIPLCARQ